MRAGGQFIKDRKCNESKNKVANLICESKNRLQTNKVKHFEISAEIFSETLR